MKVCIRSYEHSVICSSFDTLTLMPILMFSIIPLSTSVLCLKVFTVLHDETFVKVVIYFECTYK